MLLLLLLPAAMDTLNGANVIGWRRSPIDDGAALLQVLAPRRMRLQDW